MISAMPSVTRREVDIAGVDPSSPDSGGVALIRRRTTHTTHCWLLLVLVLAITLGGCTADNGALPTATPWPTPLVPRKATYTVQRGTVVDRLSLSGQVVPVVWEMLYFPVDGRLASLKVTTGTQVKQGDILAELEMQGLTEQLDQLQIGLEQAQDQFAQQQKTRNYALERARLQLRREEITLQKLERDAQDTRSMEAILAARQLEQARLNLKRAQDAYDQVSWQPGIGALPQAAALQSATLEYDIAKAQYALAVRDDTETQIALQQVQVELAQLSVKELEESIDPNLERNIAKAQLQIDSIERQMEERRLRALFDGQVIAVGLKLSAETSLSGSALSTAVTTRPEIGSAIPAFVPLVIVARMGGEVKPGDLEILIPADRDRAAELHADQMVTVTHPLYRSQPFEAQVLGVPVGAMGEGVEASSSQFVRVKLPPDAPAMAVGDHVTIEAVAAQHEGVLFLPPAAVRRYAGRTFVVVQEGEKQQTLDITVGLENQTQVEIVSGLTEGQVVLGL